MASLPLSYVRHRRTNSTNSASFGMSAKDIIGILEVCKAQIATKETADAWEIIRLKEKIEKLEIKLKSRSSLLSRIKELIEEIQSEDCRVKRKMKDYYTKKQKRMEETTQKINDQEAITGKLDCFKDEVKLEKELLTENEIRQQNFHQLMLSATLEICSDFEALKVNEANEEKEAEEGTDHCIQVEVRSEGIEATQIRADSETFQLSS